MRARPWLAAGVILLASPGLTSAFPQSPHQPASLLGPRQSQDISDLGQLDLPAWRMGLTFPDEVPIEKILTEFSAMAAVRILYSLPVPRMRISFSATDASAAEVLVDLAQAAGLTYEVIDRHTLLVMGTPPGLADRRHEIPIREIPLKKTHHAEPVYPVDLIQAGTSRIVVLQVVILRDGTVGEIEVLRGAGLAGVFDAAAGATLDAAAIDAVRQWRFRPFTLDGGRPTEVITTVAVELAHEHETDGQSQTWSPFC